MYGIETDSFWRGTAWSENFSSEKQTQRTLERAQPLTSEISHGSAALLLFRTHSRRFLTPSSLNLFDVFEVQLYLTQCKSKTCRRSEGAFELRDRWNCCSEPPVLIVIASPAPEVNTASTREPACQQTDGPEAQPPRTLSAQRRYELWRSVSAVSQTKPTLLIL